MIFHWLCAVSQCQNQDKSVHAHHQSEKVVVSDTNGHAIKSIIALFGQLSSMQQEQLLSRLLFQYIGGMSSNMSSVFFAT